MGTSAPSQVVDLEARDMTGMPDIPDRVPSPDRKVYLFPDCKEEQLRSGFDPGRIRPILKADGGCISRKTLTRVKFFICHRNLCRQDFRDSHLMNLGFVKSPMKALLSKRTAFALRVRGVAALAFVLSVSLAAAQRYDGVIPLPDSFGGLVFTRSIACSRTSHRLYVGGAYGNCVIAIDALTHERVARIPCGRDVRALVWDSQGDKIYAACAADSAVWVIDCAADSVVATLHVGDQPVALCLNSTNYRAYTADSASATVTVIDCATDSAIRTVRVGPGPRDIIWNAALNRIYCANSGDACLTVISGQTNNVIGLAPVVWLPQRMALSAPTGKLYCVGSYGDLAVYDCNQNRVLMTLTDMGNEALLWDSTTGKVFVAGACSLSIVACANDSVLARIGLGNGEFSAVAASPSQGKVYLASDDLVSSVFVIDTHGDSLLRTLPARVPVSACWSPDRDELFCASAYERGMNWTNWGFQQGSFVDCAADTLTDTVVLGCLPQELAADPVTGRLYCHDATVERPSSLLVIDGPARRVVGHIWLPGTLRTMNLVSRLGRIFLTVTNGDTAFLTTVALPADTVLVTDTLVVGYYEDSLPVAWDSTDGRVYFGLGDSLVSVDPASGCVVARYGLGQPVNLLYWNPLNDRLYCGSASIDSSLVVFDCAGDSVAARLPTNRYPVAAAFHPGRNRLYVACGLLRTIVVVDCSADTVVARVCSDYLDQPQSVVCSPASDRVYYPARSAARVLVLDCASNAVVDTVVTESLPSRLCYDAAHDKVYCAGGHAPRMTVIDCAADSTVRLPVGDGPSAVAFDPGRGAAYVVGQLTSTLSVIADAPVAMQVESGRAVHWVRASPNPFQTYTNISWAAAGRALADVRLYDRAGRVVARASGINAVRWDGRRLAAGVYFCRITTTHAAATLRLVHIR